MQMTTITGSQLALCEPHGVVWKSGAPQAPPPASWLLPLLLPCLSRSAAATAAPLQALLHLLLPERVQGQLWLRCGQASLILSDLPVVSGAGWEDNGADPTQSAHDSTGGAVCPARLPWVGVPRGMANCSGDVLYGEASHEDWILLLSTRDQSIR